MGIASPNQVQTRYRRRKQADMGASATLQVIRHLHVQGNRAHNEAIQYMPPHSAQSIAKGTVSPHISDPDSSNISLDHGVLHDAGAAEEAVDFSTTSAPQGGRTFAEDASHAHQLATSKYRTLLHTEPQPSTQDSFGYAGEISHPISHKPIKRSRSHGSGNRDLLPSQLLRTALSGSSGTLKRSGALRRKSTSRRVSTRSLNIPPISEHPPYTNYSYGLCNDCTLPLHLDFAVHPVSKHFCSACNRFVPDHSSAGEDIIRAAEYQLPNEPASSTTDPVWPRSPKCSRCFPIPSYVYQEYAAHFPVCQTCGYMSGHVFQQLGICNGDIFALFTAEVQPAQGISDDLARWFTYASCATQSSARSNSLSSTHFNPRADQNKPLRRSNAIRRRRPTKSKLRESIEPDDLIDIEHGESSTTPARTQIHRSHPQVEIDTALERTTSNPSSFQSFTPGDDATPIRCISLRLPFGNSSTSSDGSGFTTSSDDTTLMFYPHAMEEKTLRRKSSLLRSSSARRARTAEAERSEDGRAALRNIENLICDSRKKVVVERVPSEKSLKALADTLSEGEDGVDEGLEGLVARANSLCMSL